MYSSTETLEQARRIQEKLVLQIFNDHTKS